jgi:hypothetical protein
MSPHLHAAYPLLHRSRLSLVTEPSAKPKDPPTSSSNTIPVQTRPKTFIVVVEPGTEPARKIASTSKINQMDDLQISIRVIYLLP